MPMIWSVLALCTGLVLLIVAVMLRRGRSATTRSWAGAFGSTATNVLLIMPGTGIALIGVGLMRWPTSIIGALGMLLLLPVGGLLVLWGGFFQVPLALVPRWAREQVATRRRQTTGRPG